MEDTLEKFSKAIAQIDTKSDDENKLTFLVHQEKQLYKILVHLDAAYLNVNTYKETDNEELYDYIVRRKRYWFKRGYYRAAITKFVRGDLVIMLEKVLKLINEIEDRKNIITKMGSEMEKDYEKLYNQLVEHNFDQNILRGQIEKLSEKEEENYLKFCVRKFRHRTVEEWMQFYDRQDKSEQMKRLKEARLDPELEYINTLRITDAKFSESVLGQYTKKNLELFKEKYVDKALNGMTENVDTDQKIVRITNKIFKSKEEVNTFDFDFIAINDYADTLQEEDAVKYLSMIYDKVVTKTDFSDTLAKLTYEDGILDLINEKQYAVDIKNKINPGIFKVYNFNEELLFKFANQNSDIDMRIKYYNYVIREIEKATHNLKMLLEIPKDFYLHFSEYTDNVHRKALLYSSYKSGNNIEETDKYMHLIYKEELNRLTVIEKQISDELKFFKNKHFAISDNNKTTDIQSINANLNSKDEPILTELKEIPIKGLKKLAKEFCEKLILQNYITEALQETKSNKAVTNLLIPFLEQEYKLTPQNKRTLHDYFRQGQLMIKKDKTRGLIVIDTYKRKT